MSNFINIKQVRVTENTHYEYSEQEKPGFSWSNFDECYVKEVKTLENTPADMWLAKTQIQAFEKACYKGFECTQIITVSGLHIPSSLSINELLKQLN